MANRKSDAELPAAMARMLAQIMAEAGDRPALAEHFASLANRDVCREAMFDLIWKMVPPSVDPDQWLDWLNGGEVPRHPAMIDPDKGQKSARGVQQAARARRDAAATKMIRAREAVTAAEADLQNAELELEKADHRASAAVVFMIFAEFARQSWAGFAIGPMYPLLRAMSPYLQVDESYESALTDAERERVGKARDGRKGKLTEVLWQLDRLAGDERLELNIFQAVYSAVVRRAAEVDAESERARHIGRPVPPAAKRCRRQTAAQRDEVHPNAPRADASDVLDGYNFLLV